MKKFISICILVIFLALGVKAESVNTVYRNKKVESILQIKVQKVNTVYECWISEIIYNSNGTITISISCRIVPPGGGIPA